MNAAKPSIRMLSVNVNVTSVIVQPKVLVRGMRKTLHAYTAPSAICKTTPAAAILHRFGKAPPFSATEFGVDIKPPSSVRDADDRGDLLAFNLLASLERSPSKRALGLKVSLLS